MPALDGGAREAQAHLVGLRQQPQRLVEGTGAQDQPVQVGPGGDGHPHHRWVRRRAAAEPEQPGQVVGRGAGVAALHLEPVAGGEPRADLEQAVGCDAAQHAVGSDRTVDGDVGAVAGRGDGDGEDRSARQGERLPDRGRVPVDENLPGRPGDGHEHVVLGAQHELRPGHLDQGRVLGVAHQEAGNPGGVLVDRAVHGHADAAVPGATEVLDRRLAGAFDPERRDHPPACLGTKRIESPAR